ncbi:disease resistance protein SUMM2-like [Magnolia sinica]|uniref:disease resistance protein SUMM2-like n=1 Tax=Magnolia sinica TaxID=86752 RepID=UPI002659587F|nr:disease resistance protein SUMM2-like [Magnolia sinica]
MDFFKAVLEVVKFLWDPLARQISYVKNLNKNVEDLRKNMDELTSKENDVTNEIERAKLQRRVPREEVNNWLKDVENVKNEVTVIEKEFAEQERCCNGCVPDCYTARKLSKRALEKASKVHELKQKSLFEGGVAVDQLPATVHTLPTTSLEGKTSAEKTLEQILGCIMDAKIGMIGVYGMGGVGKTTIMMNINNRLKDAKHFNSIIWVTVSQDFNLERLQTDIAKKVELVLQEGDDDVSRASALYEALMKRRKFLLILDDMWKAFSLEKVGIPKPSKENGCKIALTTRSWDVCGGMKTDKVIKVQVLSEEEAWVLFKDNIGSDVVLASDVQEIAELVAKECGGLPLALITVGGALRGVKDVHEWRDALNQLRSSVTEIEGMQDEVFGRLKFSYNRLSNEKSRACFLYCSLYPEDYKIPVEEVIKYWICEGLIDEVGDIQAKIDNGHSIVNKLVRACMLESSIDNVRYVKMHDLIRDMAIGITKHNPLFIVKAGIGMEEPPNDDEWLTEVERVSLMRNKIHSLLATPNCYKLTTLFLQDNPLQGHISASLFQHMCSLRVLDLSDSHIQRLPDSLSDLVNLRALVLTECKYLSTVPSLAKMKELRLLDLSSTIIEVLPHEMEGLAKLRFLDLSGMYKLKTIETGVISKLLCLEHFMALGDGFIQAFKPQERKVSDELANLSRLVLLKLSFPNLVTFSHYVKSEQWRKLKKFSFFVGAEDPMSYRQFSYIKGDEIGDEINYLYEVEHLVYLENLRLGTRKSPLLLPANTIELAIKNCTNFSRLSLLSLTNVEGLKLCYINECRRVKSILSVEDNASFLTSLEHLLLEEVPNLQTVCQGVLATLGTFQSLKTIIIVNCHRLKNLFSAGWLKNLQKLETIFVKDCDGMEELVAEEEEDEISVTNDINNDITITLPMLKNIYLSDVHKLKKICGKVLMCSSMAFIKIKGCLKLQKIPFSVGTSPVTFEGEIEGTGKWWDKLEWDDAAIKPLLLPLYKKLEDDDTDDSDDDNDSDHDDDEEEEEEEEDDDDDDVHHYHHHHEKEASEKEETAITTTKEEGLDGPACSSLS